MKTAIAYVALAGALCGSAAHATGAGTLQEIPAVPSGQQISLQEVFLDVKPDGVLTYARFRFVAPEIGSIRTYGDVEADFAFLCSEYALPVMQKGQDHVDQIVISLASQPVEFGASDPDTTQYFEAFRIENATCIWEEF